MTIVEAVEIMRNMTGEPPGEQCRAMMQLADVWEEAEGVVACGCDGGSQDTGGVTPWGEPISEACNLCHGTGLVPPVATEVQS